MAGGGAVGRRAPGLREPQVNLWIGPGGHLVHYPIRAGAAVNIVAVTSDDWQSTQWSTAADRDEMLARFPPLLWASEARDLLAAPERRQKWALYDRAPSTNWGHGPVTLLGDAAHPMLPFLAQGAAMAIEGGRGRDALAPRGDPAGRCAITGDSARRAARVQRAARRAARLSSRPPASFMRDAPAASGAVSSRNMIDLRWS
jgi:salicylate hydroxylase